MNSWLRIPLQPSTEQHARLLALQGAFAEVCNALAPVVQRTRVWNRVALHHMAYKSMRERYPALGSQMVCNAIYSVSRASRLLFQSPGSPFNVARQPDRPLPLLRFADTCPVYFDRHTLSLRDGQASVFTLDGRMRFQLALTPQQEQAFHTRKLLEVVLNRRAEQFELSFVFGPEAGGDPAADAAQLDVGAEELAQALSDATAADLAAPATTLPDYLQIEETA
jgi:hypothetical protein